MSGNNFVNKYNILIFNRFKVSFYLCRFLLGQVIIFTENFYHWTNKSVLQHHAKIKFRWDSIILCIFLVTKQEKRGH